MPALCVTMDKWTSGAAYDQWMGRWSRLLADEFLKWLNLPSNLRWLDVCCGSGMLTETIVERFAPARVAAIDASPQQIEFARAHRACLLSPSKLEMPWPSLSPRPASMLPSAAWV